MSPWRKVSSDFVFTAVVAVTLVLVVFVVSVGGIVCVRDDRYTFTEYLDDLQGLSKLLGIAVAAAFGRSLIDGSARRGMSNGDKKRDE